MCTECVFTVDPVSGRYTAVFSVSSLSEGAQRLWDKLSPDADDAALSILEEAVRIKHRCDRLDSLVEGLGEAWLEVSQGDDGSTRVYVDKVLEQARAHAMTFKAVMAEFRMYEKRKSAAQSTKDEESAGPNVSSILARIAEKRASAAS